MTSLKDKLQKAVNLTVPLDLASQLTHHACVSVILRGTELHNLELGFIQRALNEEDRWSGQLAFPGGRREPTDKTDLDAAVRETLEEIGLPLNPSQDLLGRLSDIQARKAGKMLEFYIRPFVFHSNQPGEIKLDLSEVADFFWVPLQEIQNPARRTSIQIQTEEQSLHLPAIHLDREPPLWGLTYLMVQDLLSRLNSDRRNR